MDLFKDWVFKEQLATIYLFASLLKWQPRLYEYGMISTTVVIMYCLVKPYLAKLYFVTLTSLLCWKGEVSEANGI